MDPMMRSLQGLLTRARESDGPLFAAFAKVRAIPDGSNTQKPAVPATNAPVVEAANAPIVEAAEGRSSMKKEDAETKPPMFNLAKALRRQRPEERLVKVSEGGADIGVSEEEMMAVAMKLQRKYKKAQKDMCCSCRGQGITKIQTTVRMGNKNKEYKMQMYLFDLVNLAKQGITTIPPKFLN